jgi:hypothetical protein
MSYSVVITDAKTGKTSTRPYTQAEIDAAQQAEAIAADQRRAAMSLSFAQLLIGLVTEKWITADDGRAWRDRTALPPAVADLIATLPAEQQFAAETRAMAFTEALRLDPLVEALGAAEGKTPEELDTFFLTYAQV